MRVHFALKPKSLSNLKRKDAMTQHPMMRTALLQAADFVDGLSEATFQIEEVIEKSQQLLDTIKVHTQLDDPYDDNENDALHLLLLSKSGDKAFNDYLKQMESREQKQLLITEEYALRTNLELRELLQDYERGLEIIMHKYRSTVTEDVIAVKTNFAELQNDELVQEIFEYKQQIARMKNLMREAARRDEKAINQQTEALAYLECENKKLRELHDIAREFGSIQQPIKFNELCLCDQATQTKDDNEAAEGFDDDETPRNADVAKAPEDFWFSYSGYFSDTEGSSEDPVDFEEPPHHNYSISSSESSSSSSSDSSTSSTGSQEAFNICDILGKRSSISNQSKQ